MRTHLLPLLPLLIPSAGLAQDTVVVIRPGVAALGTPAARRAVALFNDPGTTRVFGADTVGPDMVITGHVGVLNGPLRVEGTILGDLVAINADLAIAAGAEIRGDILVLGGRVVESDDARLFGTLERHGTGIRVRRVGDRLELLEEPDRVRRGEGARRLPRSWRATRASIGLSTGGTYNRVEGLPILLGPRITWGRHDLDVRIDARAIFRTAAGLDTDERELGYTVDGRLRIGRAPRLEVGGRLYDVVAPVEDWTLHDDEVGWAAFLFHRDYRDYYLARGAGGYLRLYPTRDLMLFGELGRVEATSAAIRDPWTPFRNAELWRANPAVDEGDFTVVTAGVELDTRYARRWDWETGLYLRAEWERGIADGVSPLVLPTAVRDPIPADWTYDRAVVDLRIYQPVGIGGVSLRALGAGTLGGDPLPVQRRLSLGGPDPLPGYPFRAFACNGAVTDPAQPALCDRVLLFQAEYRGGLDFDLFDWDRHSHQSPAAVPPHRRAARGGGEAWDEWWGDWDWPHFVLFANAGAAWISERDDGPGALHWDVGGGLEFGSVGVYAARALAADEPLRIILRLHHRF